MQSPLGAFLCPPGYTGPTGLRALAREGSAITEAARFVRRRAFDRLKRRRTAYPWGGTAVPPPGPVVLIPGFMAGDASLLLLSQHLRRRGYRTYRSMMRANVGCTQEASMSLERRIEAIAIRRERKVTVVGHSLGGLLARGIAARRPDLVEAIVTLGSPILAPGAVHPLLAFDLAVVIALRHAGWGTLDQDCTSGGCARLSWEQSQRRLDHDMAFTTIYSRRDGIVDWRSCLDPAATAVEVRTSHLGMAVDPVVFDAVASALEANHRDRYRRPELQLLAETAQVAAS